MTCQEMKRRLVPIYGEQETQAILRMVFEVRFGMSRADILSGKVTQLSADDTAELEKIVARLEKSEPVQYILGIADFCGRSFLVSPNVLIPRPETEELCWWMKETVLSQQAKRSLLDIGTGSGCIAVTMSLELPGSMVEAWDVSNEAVAVAQANAERLKADVQIVEKDIRKVEKSSMKWDIIVSNPPYITSQEKAEMEANVLAYEPHLALFVPNDEPLYFYRLICRYATQALNDGGWLFFEINPLFADALVQLLKEHGFVDVELKTDAFGKQRFVRAVIGKRQNI